MAFVVLHMIFIKIEYHGHVTDVIQTVTIRKASNHGHGPENDSYIMKKG